VVGRTAAADRRKGETAPKRVAVPEAEFLTAARAALPDDEYRVVVAVVEWAKKAGLAGNFKRGVTDTTFLPPMTCGGRTLYPMSLAARTGLWLNMARVKNYPPFSDPAFRAEFHRRLEATGATVPADRMVGYPQLKYEALASASALAAILDALGWLVAELRKVPANT
jgi:hypothetical protein